MALFSSNQDPSSENQAYADFLNAYNLTQDQIKDLKNGIFEHIRNLHQTFQSTQRQAATNNDSTSTSLATWAPEIAKIGLLGTLMTLIERHTRETASSLLALNNYLNPAGGEQKGFTSTDKVTPKEESSKTNELLKDLGIAIKESKAGQMVKGAWDELLTLIGLGALAVLVVPFIGPLVEWFDKNFGTNMKAKYDALMEPFQGYVKTVKDTFNKVTDWLELLITDPKEAFSQAVESIKNIGQYLWAKIKPGFNVVKNVMSGAYEYLKEKLTNYYDQFVEFLTGKPGASNVFDEAYDRIKGFWDSFMQSAEKFMTDMDMKGTFDLVKKYLEDFWTGVKVFGNELTPTLDETKNIFVSLKKTISDIWDSGIIQSKIEGVMDSLVDKVKEMALNLYQTVVDSVIGFVQKFFGDLITRLVDEAIIKLWGDPILVPKFATPQRVLDAQKRAKEREDVEKAKEQERLAKEEAKKRLQMEKEKQRAEASAKFEKEHPELTKMMKEKSDEVNGLMKHTSDSFREMTEKIVGKLEETKTTSAAPTVINNGGGGAKSSGMSPIPTSKTNGVDMSRSFYINNKPVMLGF